MKVNENAARSAAVGCPIATAGEVFADGAMIELVGGAHPTQTLSMLWNGSTEVIGRVVEYDGQLYTPAPIESSILRELTLPTRCCPPHSDSAHPSPPSAAHLEKGPASREYPLQKTNSQVAENASWRLRRITPVES